jgi:MFS family permease
MQTRPSSLSLALFVTQLALALCWSVYVIFLPGLAAQVGITPQQVLWILLADQLLFALMDVALGRWGDRVMALAGRMAPLVIVAVATATAAFIALPLVAQQGSPGLLLTLVVVWVLASSLLRVPMLLVCGRYALGPNDGRWLAFGLVALGVGGAIAPFLAVWLKGVAPTLPFVLASASLVVAALAFVACERNLPRRAASPADATPQQWPLRAWLAVFLLALGTQIHTALNSVPLFQRSAAGTGLEWLMPWFWVAFGLTLTALGVWPPASRLQTLATSAVLGAVAMAVAATVPNLPSLIAAQMATGALWGLIFCSATSLAVQAGHCGREGRLLGGLFGLFALAAVLRIGVLAWPLVPTMFTRQDLFLVPAVLWALAAALLTGARFKPLGFSTGRPA